MREFEVWMVLAALVGGAVGVWGIVWERIGHGRTSWGRGIAVGAIVFLGAGSTCAAFFRDESLVPLGLSAGFLVVGLLWGDPRASSPESSPSGGFHTEHP